MKQYNQSRYRLGNHLRFSLLSQLQHGLSWGLIKYLKSKTEYILADKDFNETAYNLIVDLKRINNEET
jgi:hypothetical protein